MNDAFLAMLARQIEAEAVRYAETNPEESDDLSEPYRAAGDRLVDAALELVG